VPVIDATVLSAALYTSLGLCPSSGVTSGASGAFFCNDTTHFEKAGALQIAQMVGKASRIRGLGWQPTWPTSRISVEPWEGPR